MYLLHTFEFGGDNSDLVVSADTVFLVTQSTRGSILSLNLQESLSNLTLVQPVLLCNQSQQVIPI